MAYTVTAVTATTPYWNGTITRLDGSGNSNVLQVKLGGQFDVITVGIYPTSGGSRDATLGMLVESGTPTAPASIDWTAVVVGPAKYAEHYVTAKPGDTLSLRLLFGGDITQFVYLRGQTRI